MHAEDKHFDLGKLFVDLSSGFQTFEFGHDVVHDDDIGFELVSFGHGFSFVDRLATDGPAGLLTDDVGQFLVDYFVVGGDEYAEGFHGLILDWYPASSVGLEHADILTHF